MSFPSHPPLWCALEPNRAETRLLLSEPGVGVRLKARLPLWPKQPGAVLDLLDALSRWHGRPLHAVIDADAEDVRLHPERWARALGDAPPGVEVDWLAVPPRQRDRFLASLGDFRSARRALSHAATGVR